MTWQSLPNRVLAQVVRPTARPVGWGIVVAASFLVAEALAVLALKQIAPENAFGAILLLGVLVVSAGWGFGLAIAMSLASAALYAYIHLEGRGSLAPSLAVFLTLALLTNVLVGQARLRAAEAEQRRRQADVLAGQQAALRRVATLVARAAAPAEVFSVAVRELAHSLDVDHVTLVCFESDDTCIVLAAQDRPGSPGMPQGERLVSAGDNISSRIRDDRAPPLASTTTRRRPARSPPGFRALGVRSGAGVPLIVDGAVRGALLVGSRAVQSISAATRSPHG